MTRGGRLLLSLLSVALAAAAEPPVAPGTVAVVLDDADAAPDETSAYVEAAAAALAAAGFTPLPDAAHSRYVTALRVARDVSGTVASPGHDAAAPSYRGGGLALALPSNKDRLHPLVVTRLSVTVSQRGDRRVVWRGEAVTARAEGTPGGARSTVAIALAQALFRWFPHPLEAPLSVP